MAALADLRVHLAKVCPVWLCSAADAYISVGYHTNCIDILSAIVLVLASTASLTSIHIRSRGASHGGRHHHARRNRETSREQNYGNDVETSAA